MHNGGCLKVVRAKYFLKIHLNVNIFKEYVYRCI